MGLIDRLKNFRKMRTELPPRIGMVLDELVKSKDVIDVDSIRPLLGHSKDVRIEVKDTAYPNRLVSMYVYLRDRAGKGVGYLVQVTCDGTKEAITRIKEYAGKIQLNGDDYLPRFV